MPLSRGIHLFAIECEQCDSLRIDFENGRENIPVFRSKTLGEIELPHYQHDGHNVRIVEVLVIRDRDV